MVITKVTKKVIAMVKQKGIGTATKRHYILTYVNLAIRYHIQVVLLGIVKSAAMILHQNAKYAKSGR